MNVAAKAVDLLSIEELKNARVMYKVRRDFTAVAIIDELLARREEEVRIKELESREIILPETLGINRDWTREAYDAKSVVRALNKQGFTVKAGFYDYG